MWAHVLCAGGIGMSGIARLYRQKGWRVSGNDADKGGYLSQLQKEGIEILDIREAGKEPDILVISSATKQDDPELLFCKAKGVEIIHRTEALARILDGKRVIGITGAHGKTTTTAMLSWLLLKSGFDPTTYIGGILRGFSNARIGSGDWAVIEMDESDGSFVRFTPDVVVLTNVDLEHIDFFANKDNVVSFFSDYVLSRQRKGLSTIIGSNSPLKLSLARHDYISFCPSKDGFDVCNFEVVPYNTQKRFLCRYDVVYRENGIGRVSLPLQGMHNALNSLFIFEVARALGIDIKEVFEALSSFPGVERRLDVFYDGDWLVINDYAHHPAEINKTLKGIRTSVGARRVIAVFEPHRYTRFSCLWNDFLEAFRPADIVCVANIYSAAEAPVEGVSSERFAEEVPNGIYCPDVNVLKDIAQKGDVFVFLGAGKVIALAKRFADWSKNEYIADTASA